MMKYETISEVITTLIGSVTPIGETSHDAIAMRNLDNMIYLVDDLLFEIASGVKNSERFEYSIKESGDRCIAALKDYKEMIDTFLPNDTL